MPYLGRPVTNAGQFEIIDDISSSFNGSNTSFTLQVGGTNIQPDSANVTIALDGIIQIPPTSYSITGSTLNFSEAPENGTGFHGVLAGQSQFIESDFITDTHIKSTANISGSKINTDFSAQNIQITHITSSGNISGSSSSTISTGTFTGTFSGALSSSAQIASNISGSFTPVSTSLASRVTTNETDLTTLKGSGTTQGVGQSNSPTFAGGTVTGDFTVGGTLTAQEIHTEFTSASILFTSGSTKFGNSGDDIHNMTGSIRVSGSAVNDSFFLGHNIGIGITSPTTYYEKVLHIHESAGSSAIHLTNNTTGTTRDDGTDLIEYQDDFYIFSREAAGNIIIGTNATERLRISGSGEAIFSSDVKAAKFEVYTTSTTDPVLILGDQGVADYNWTFPDTGTIKLSTNTASSKKLFLKNDGSGEFNLEIDGTLYIPGYLEINQAAQNGIKIKTDDTAVIWVYDKSSDAITGGINFAHADGTILFYTNGTNERMRITTTGYIVANGASDYPRASRGNVFRSSANGNAAITLLSPSNHSAGVGQDIVSLNFAANNLWGDNKDAVYAQIRCENGNGSYADRGQLVFAVGYNGDTINDRMTLSYDGILGFDTGLPASGTGATKGIHINTGGVPFIRYQETNSYGGTADYEIYVANGVYVLYDNDDSAGVYTVSTSQVISGDFNDTSDIGLKENIKTIDSGLSVVNKLNPVTFDWKNKKKGSNSGFIAQEVEKLLPNDVEGEDFNTDYPSGRVGDVTEDEDKGFNNFGKSINLGGIVAHLTKAVQELSEEVEKLKGK